MSRAAFAAAGSGLHHKLCHVLGGTFNLVHADTHSVILPHAVAFNRDALPQEMERLAGQVKDLTDQLAAERLRREALERALSEGRK